MRITFFRTARPRQFKYMPWFYDEQKEEADKRKKRIEQELGIKDSSKAYRSTMHRGVMSAKLSEKKKANRGTILRLLIILTILVLLTYYLLSSDFTFSFLPK